MPNKMQALQLEMTCLIKAMPFFLGQPRLHSWRFWPLNLETLKIDTLHVPSIRGSEAFEGPGLARRKRVYSLCKVEHPEGSRPCHGGHGDWL